MSVPPQSGSKPPGGVDSAKGATRVDGTAPTSAVDPAEAVGAADAAGAVERTGPVDAPQPTSPLDAVVGALAAQLRGGQITVEQAVSALIQDAIDRQVAAALVDNPEAEAEVREALTRHLAEDPYLIQKVRRLHQAK